MVTCEICGEKTNKENVLKINIDSETHCICMSCFLLSVPSVKYLQNLNVEDTIKTSNNPELDSYLYNKILGATSSSSPYTSNKKSKTSSNSNYDSQANYAQSQYGYYLDSTPPVSLYGRDKEMMDIINILSKKSKNNLIVLGESGVGKTAIIKALADNIASGNVPDCLKDKRIYSVDLGALVAGAKYRGDFEARFKDLMNKIAKDDTILFFDEIHMLTSAGDCESGTTAANLLKPLLTERGFQVIGATTFEEYKKTIDRSDAFARRFQVVKLREQSKEEIIPLLSNIKDEFASYHNIQITSEVISDCVNLADKYIKYRHFPDKAIDLLDTACAYKKNKMYMASDDCMSIENIIDDLLVKYDLTLNIQIHEVLAGNYPNFADFSREVQKKVRKHRKDITPTNIHQLKYEDLAHIVESWTDIPVSDIDGNTKSMLKSLAPKLKSTIIGQDEAIDLVIKAVLRRRLSITDTKHPASFIFVGETGVGKTQLAKDLAVNLFGSSNKLIRFDMSEYMEKHTVSKLIGSPPGYVGYEDSGVLTEAVKNNPFCILLFDEIEKAHHDVSNILLQILDDGVVTDSHGCKISCENAIIIMTSNAGTSNDKGIGFGKSINQINKEAFEAGLKSAFRPEFLGRIDAVVNFNSLTKENYYKIIENDLNKLINQLEKKKIKLNCDINELVEYIYKKADCTNSHAREIGRTITKEVEDRIVELIFDSDEPVSRIRIDIDGNELKMLASEMTVELVK